MMSVLIPVSYLATSLKVSFTLLPLRAEISKNGISFSAANAWAWSKGTYLASSMSALFPSKTTKAWSLSLRALASSIHFSTAVKLS